MGIFSFRSVQDSIGPALHRAGAAVPGPRAEPAGGPAQREEEPAVFPGVPAHRPPAGLLGVRPAEDQDGHLPAQVKSLVLRLQVEPRSDCI